MLTQHKPRESYVGTYLLHQASVALQVKILAATAGDVGDSGDMGLIPGLGRSHRGGNGNSLQYSCLENPMDRGARLATVYRVTKSQTHTHTHPPVTHNAVCSPVCPTRLLRFTLLYKY